MRNGFGDKKTKSDIISTCSFRYPNERFREMRLVFLLDIYQTCIPKGDKHGRAVCDDPHVRFCERRMNLFMRLIYFAEIIMLNSDFFLFLHLLLHYLPNQCDTNETSVPMVYMRCSHEASYSIMWTHGLSNIQP